MADEASDLDAVRERSDDLWSWFRAMVGLSAVNSGVELGLFEALRSGGPRALESLAQQCHVQADALRVWAAALIERGWLVAAADDTVALAPGVESVVCDRDTLAYLAPSVRYHARFLASDFLDISNYLRDGVIRPPSRHGPALVRNIAAQTAAMHAVFLGAVLPEVPVLREALSLPCRVLDVGCGTGTLGELLCRTLDRVHYTGIDPDATAIAMGQQRLAGAGLGDRAALHCIPAEAFEAPAPFDLAFLFLSLHEIDPSVRPTVLEATRHALRPGGLLVVFDEMFPASLADITDEPDMGIHFAYTELVWSSRVPTLVETLSLLADAGFEQVQPVPVLNGAMTITIGQAP